MAQSNTSSSRLTHPVFVCGCHRSGTSLLRNILNRHSQIDLLPETKLGAWFWSPWLPVRFRHRDKLLDELETHMPLLNRAWADSENSARIDALKKGRSHAPGKFHSMPDIMAYLLETCCHQSATVVGEKSPLHIYHLPHLLRRFPKARFIIVQRDLRGAYHSQEHRSQRKQLSYRAFRALPFISAWRNSATLSSRYLKKYGTEQIYHVRFESLVQKPRQELNQLCHFLNLPFEEGMLAVETENSSFEDLPGGISTEVSKRWETGLSEKIQKELTFLRTPYLDTPSTHNTPGLKLILSRKTLSL